MDSDIQELITVLEDLAILLEAEENAHWAAWAQKGRERLLNSDYSGIEYVLSGYGGMGSLNDLVLGHHHDSGNASQKSRCIKANDRFKILRNRAWELANSIDRSHSQSRT